ncbi:MAG: VWA domain-containing protein [Acidobacteriota bacterium]
MVKGRARSGRLPLAGLSLLFLWGSSALFSQEKPTANQPADIGLHEESGVSLILLDVEVRDKEGRPLPGLTKDDFTLYRGARRWPIYSVDDLCTCASAGETLATGPSPLTPAAPAPASETDLRPEETFRYILYFDFSQLQLNGRDRAFAAARRWIREIMQPGNQVMIMAYRSTNGLEQLVPFTQNPAELEDGLDAIENNPAFVEPFPSQFYLRVGECGRCVGRCEGCRLRPCVECCPSCYVGSRQEFEQGRRAFLALRQFLAALDGVPGRKALIFFHQNNILFPALFYPLDDFTVGNHLKLAEQVGAEATSARVALYPVQTGGPHLFSELAGSAANLGSNLADYSGGHANTGPFDLFDVISTAGRGCSCTYRIAARPPPGKAGKVYRARVEVHGRSLPYRYRVQYLSASQRLVRRALTALLMPDPATGLPMRAALVPVSATGGRWDLAVQVGVEFDSLRFLPFPQEPVARLDVGASLSRRDSSKRWEMLTGASVRSRESRRPGLLLLHEHRFEHLPPGNYRLGAFVHQRDLDLWGSVRVEIDLPRVKKKTALAGPVMRLPGGIFFPSPLPLRSRNPPASAGDPLTSRVGPVPSASAGVPQGQIIEMTTLACGAGETPAMETIIRYVSRGGIPMARPPGGRLEPAGDCARFTDGLDTAFLAPGEYAYHFRWQAADRGGKPLEKARSFRVVPPQPGRSTTLVQPSRRPANSR